MTNQINTEPIIEPFVWGWQLYQSLSNNYINLIEQHFIARD